MSRSLLTLAMVALLVVIEGVVHARTAVHVDVAGLALAYFVLERPVVSGAASALVVGYLVDVSAGLPSGLYATAAVLAFLVLRVGVAKLRWSGPLFSTLIGLLTVALVPLWVLTLDALLGPGTMSWAGALPAVPALVLSTILLCYPLHRLLARIDERLGRPDDEFVLR